MFNTRNIENIRMSYTQNSYMIYIMNNQLMNKPTYQKCQNLQLMVDCEVISLLCIGYQDI
jgi:hypothetical protein